MRRLAKDSQRLQLQGRPEPGGAFFSTARSWAMGFLMLWGFVDLADGTRRLISRRKVHSDFYRVELYTSDARSCFAECDDKDEAEEIASWFGQDGAVGAEVTGPFIRSSA